MALHTALLGVPAGECKEWGCSLGETWAGPLSSVDPYLGQEEGRPVQLPE